MTAPPSTKPMANTLNYNHELLTCIKELREKRDALSRQIVAEDEEARQVKSEIGTLTERLGQINDSLARKNQTKAEYDKTIEETQTAYDKIRESSQTLLHVLRRETKSLDQKTQLVCNEP